MHRYTLPELVLRDGGSDRELQRPIPLELKAIAEEVPEALNKIGVADEVHRIVVVRFQTGGSDSNRASAPGLGGYVARLTPPERLLDGADASRRCGCFEDEPVESKQSREYGVRV